MVVKRVFSVIRASLLIPVYCNIEVRLYASRVAKVNLNQMHFNIATQSNT